MYKLKDRKHHKQQQQQQHSNKQKQEHLLNTTLPGPNEGRSVAYVMF